MKIDIPAGLEDQNLEIYRHGNNAHAIFNGKSIDYLKLPDSIREIFQAEIISDKKVFQCLQLSMMITDVEKMEETYVGCRYGAMNFIPDLINGKTKSDIPTCDEIETCPGYGIVCKAPEGPGGRLAKKEFIIGLMISKGMLDKEIADKLGIKIPTIRTHINRIREKLRVNNRIEIALFFHKNGSSTQHL
jgi:DNA-binding CsgD family transcriptional regulator